MGSDDMGFCLYKLPKQIRREKAVEKRGRRHRIATLIQRYLYPFLITIASVDVTRLTEPLVSVNHEGMAMPTSDNPHSQKVAQRIGLALGCPDNP
jgi:hypothetical protein